MLGFILLLLDGTGIRLQLFHCLKDTEQLFFVPHPVNLPIHLNEAVDSDILLFLCVGYECLERNVENLSRFFQDKNVLGGK